MLFVDNWTLDKLEMAGVDTHIWVQMSINRPYLYPDNFYKIQPGKLVQIPVDNHQPPILKNRFTFPNVRRSA